MLNIRVDPYVQQEGKQVGFLYHYIDHVLERLLFSVGNYNSYMYN